MRLTPPTRIVFLISLVIAAAAFAMRYLGVDLGVPYVGEHVTAAALTAWVVLAFGVLLRGF